MKDFRNPHRFETEEYIYVTLYVLFETTVSALHGSSQISPETRQVFEILLEAFHPLHMILQLLSGCALTSGH